MTKDLVEVVARAIVRARGGNPDDCVSGYGWAAGEMGKAEAGYVCHRRAWKDRTHEARAAIQAMIDAGPTEAMVEAATDGLLLEEAYLAMLRAALKENEHVG